jgi:hypothetical protein
MLRKNINSFFDDELDEVNNGLCNHYNFMRSFGFLEGCCSYNIQQKKSLISIFLPDVRRFELKKDIDDEDFLIKEISAVINHELIHHLIKREIHDRDFIKEEDVVNVISGTFDFDSCNIQDNYLKFRKETMSNKERKVYKEVVRRLLL